MDKLKMNNFILLLMVATNIFGLSLAKVLLPKEFNGHLAYAQQTRESVAFGETYAASDADTLRLPEGITPETYTISIIPNLKEDSFNFSGSVEIKVSVQVGGNKTITMHAKSLNITDHIVTSDGVTNMFSNATTNGEFYILNLNTALKNDTTYTISMEFSGYLNDDMDGFYRSSYRNSNGTTEWMAVTQFEMTSARKAFPCFDEPHLKANFTLSIARDKNMTTLSNMPLLNTTNDTKLPDGYVWDNYPESPKMATYFFAFTVSKFLSNGTNFNSGDAGNKPFKVWAPESSIDQIEYSLEVGPSILEVMKNITGVDYALPKMDMIAIPDFQFGAMENWGLVTFREMDLLYKEGTSSASSRQRVATVIAHELSHQWFGDLVTLEWWKYAWLNEGFATYFMYTATGILKPEWRLMEQFVIEQLQTAFLRDALESTHPMTNDVCTPDEILSMFDDISYNKGGSVIRMMEHILGRETFFKGLGRYLVSRSFNSGNEDQLFDALDAQAKLDNSSLGNLTMKEIMKGWTNQVGYPVINVARGYETGEANITQERFISENFTSDALLWTVPITYTTQDSLDFNKTSPMTWMDKTESINIDGLPLGDKWVIFNTQVTGFYRVNYDEKNWKLITDYLNSDNHVNIHPLNKAQLISDSLNLARGGYLDYNITLDLTSYLANETDFIPWYSVYKPFEFVGARMDNSTEKEKYNIHVQHLLKKQYSSLGFNVSSDEDPIQSLSRSQILPWACKHDYKDCLATAKALFSELHGNNDSIPGDLKSTVYCYGVASGAKAEWDFLWNRFISTTVASEKSVILNALGCSKDTTIIEGYLNKSITENSGIRKQDRQFVFSSVINTAEGVDFALDYMIKNFAALMNGYGESTFEEIVIALANRITSDDQTKKMKIFLTSNANILGDAAKQATKAIDSNIDWSKKYLPTIESWLNERYPSSSTVNRACVMIVLAVSFFNCYF